MSKGEERPPTIESFYHFGLEGKLMGLRCDNNHFFLPAKTKCPYCNSTNFAWNALSGRGKLVSYTQVFSAPRQLEKHVPYFLGMVRLDEGPQLLGLIKNAKETDLCIGLEVAVGFEVEESSSWPKWPRIVFTYSRS